jgi:hypothetical protein
VSAQLEQDINRLISAVMSGEFKEIHEARLNLVRLFDAYDDEARFNEDMYDKYLSQYCDVYEAWKEVNLKDLPETREAMNAIFKSFERDDDDEEV